MRMNTHARSSKKKNVRASNEKLNVKISKYKRKSKKNVDESKKNIFTMRTLCSA